MRVKNGLFIKKGIVLRKRDSLEAPRNRAVVLVDIIVSISEVEFTKDGPPKLRNFKKQHGEKG